MKNIILFLFTVSLVFADGNVEAGNIKSTFEGGIQIGSNNSIGFSNMVTATISDISSGNSGSLSDFSSIAAGVYFENSSKINYHAGITLDKANEWYPASIGIVYPYNDFVFGLAYFQKYSDFSEFPPTRTVYKPLDTGEKYSAIFKTIIHSPSGMVAYSFNNLLSPVDRLTFGVQVFWDFWNEENKLFNIKETINANSPSWKIGLVYKINKDLGFGVCFEKGVDLEGTSGPDIGVEQQVLFKLPDKLSFGFSGQTIGDFIFSTTATLVYWNSIQSQFQEQLNLSASLVCPIYDLFDISLGVYKSDKSLSERYIYFNYDDNVTFIDLGVRTKIRNFNIFAELLDSHNFTSKYRKQTILKFGLDYQLD